MRFDRLTATTAATCLVLAVALPASRGTAATFIGPYPFAVGDSFTYAYHSVDVYQSSGSPTTTTHTYTTTTAIQSPINYSYPPSNGSVRAFPIVTTATETNAAGTYTTKTTQYRNFVTQPGARAYVLYGTDDVSDLLRPDKVTRHLSTVEIYATPYMLDALPERTNATWALPIANSTTIDNEYFTGSGASNILQSKIARKADASYTNSGMDYDVPYTIVQKVDGTGTLAIGPATSQEQWNFGKPVASAKGEIIPVIVTYQGKTGTNAVPDWYSGKGAAPRPLATSTFLDEGAKVVPSGCGNSAGMSAVLLHAVYHELAPAAGFVQDQTEDHYVIAGKGRVCNLVHYAKTQYDAKVSGKVTSTETFDSTSGLMSETLH